MDPQANIVEHLRHPRKRVLFLGYGREQTTLVDELVNANCEVWHTQGKIVSTQGYDLAISYGYRHILTRAAIESSRAPIINLHISYLPWNRGAHPNFWSFFDCTPSGVSIHLIDGGIDTGPVIDQRYVNFPKELKTFAQTYRHLNREIEALFRQNLEEIIEGTYTAVPQRRPGTFHKAADLPDQFSGWDADIEDEIRRLDALIARET